MKEGVMSLGRKSLVACIAAISALTLTFNFLHRPLPTPESLRPQQEIVILESTQAYPSIPTTVSTTQNSIPAISTPLANKSINPYLYYSWNGIAYPLMGRYWYKTDGYEKYGRKGIVMQPHVYPSRSKRELVYDGAGMDFADYEMRHFFSDESEWRASIRLEKKRTSMRRFYIEGEQGELTLDPRPYLMTEQFPYRVGDKWESKWTDDDDKISGDFRRVVSKRGYLTVGGESIEVYKLETYFEYIGPYIGSGYMEEWIAPERMLTVKTYFRQEGQFGPFDYKSEVTLTLESLTPERI